MERDLAIISKCGDVCGGVGAGGGNLHVYQIVGDVYRRGCSCDI